MSHVATVDLEVRDLDALEEAAKRIGLELVRGQTSYRWWGQHVGDYPLPQGFSEDDLGKCEHALRVKDQSSTKERGPLYEIGIVKRRDGRPGYTLLWDFIDTRLVKVVGGDCSNLKREYAAVTARKAAIARGFTVNEHRHADGRIELRCTK